MHSNILDRFSGSPQIAWKISVFKQDVKERKAAEFEESSEDEDPGEPPGLLRPSSAGSVPSATAAKPQTVSQRLTARVQELVGQIDVERLRRLREQHLQRLTAERSLWLQTQSAARRGCGLSACEQSAAAATSAGDAGDANADGDGSVASSSDILLEYAPGTTFLALNRLIL